MPRNSSDNYELPSNAAVQSGDTIEAAHFNSVMNDIEAEQVATRPVSAGGTGANTASTARQNLGITSQLATKRNTADEILESEVTGLSSRLTTIEADISTNASGITNLGTVASGTTNGLMSTGDFTKLAGIETGATADMTATEIKTAVEGLGNLNAASLGGVIAGNYARSDTGDIMSGQYTFTDATLPLTVTGDATTKIRLSGADQPSIRFDEDSNEKMTVGWSTDGYAYIANAEDASTLYVKDDLEFSDNGGTSKHSVFHEGNVNGAISNITTSDLTASRATVTDTSGKIVASTVTAIELGYLSGLTTSVASLVSGSQFASGTKMLFNQTSAPTGWVKQTTHHDAAIRVTNSTVGFAGNKNFSTSFSSYVPAGTTGVTLSGTISGTALTVAQLPSHSHALGSSAQIRTTDLNTSGSQIADSTLTGGTTAGSLKSDAGTAGNMFGGSTESVGTGSEHTHAHTLSTTSTFTGSASAFAVKYVDVIIAQKT